MKKKIITISAILMIGIICRFWIGIYIHDEFQEKHVFIKHRPIWKWKFYSPIGMTDQTLEDLNAANEEEQLMFNEFIRDQGMSR